MKRGCSLSCSCVCAAVLTTTGAAQAQSPFSPQAGYFPGGCGPLPASPWTPAQSLLVGCNGNARAVLGGDNRIYVLGGHTGSVLLSDVQVFDGATWSFVASLPSPRLTAAAVDGQGRVYAIGGGDGAQTLTEVLRYDAGGNAWTPVAPLPSPRGAHATATDAYGRIYVMGGNDGLGAGLASVVRYDPATNSWTPLASMTVARSTFAAYCAPNGSVYVFGGAGCCGAELASIERYDPLTDTWTVLPAALADARQAPGGAGPDGRFYIVAGWSPGYTAQVEVFDPKTETLSAYPSFDRFTNNHAVVTRGNHIYGIGGDGGDASVSRTLRPVYLFAQGDANGDQSVDFPDITSVLANWGAGCP